MLEHFWVTVLWAAFTILTSIVGYSYIAEKILLLYGSIMKREEHRRFFDSWRELQRARRELGEISAQDEFARWARQQRKVDQLQANFDNLKGQRQRSLQTKQLVMALTLRILFYAVMMWAVMVRTRGISLMTLPLEVIGPLGYLLAIPSLPIGSLSAPVFFAISTMAFKRILSIVE